MTARRDIAGLAANAVAVPLLAGTIAASSPLAFSWQISPPRPLGAG